MKLIKGKKYAFSSISPISRALDAKGVATLLSETPSYTVLNEDTREETLVYAFAWEKYDEKDPLELLITDIICEYNE